MPWEKPVVNSVVVLYSIVSKYILSRTWRSTDHPNEENVDCNEYCLEVSAP